jgi:hypothetical protein
MITSRGWRIATSAAESISGIRSSIEVSRVPVDCNSDNAPFNGPGWNPRPRHHVHDTTSTTPRPRHQAKLDTRCFNTTELPTVRKVVAIPAHRRSCSLLPDHLLAKTVGSWTACTEWQERCSRESRSFEPFAYQRFRTPTTATLTLTNCLIPWARHHWSCLQMLGNSGPISPAPRYQAELYTGFPLRQHYEPFPWSGIAKGISAAEREVSRDRHDRPQRPGVVDGAHRRLPSS